MKITLLALALLLVGCSNAGTTTSTMSDGNLKAEIAFKQHHPFLAEYERSILINNGKTTKRLTLPLDTGGDLPIHVYRHKDESSDFLRLRGGIYHILIDLEALVLPEEHNSVDGKIFSDRVKLDKIPPAVASWVIDRDFSVTKENG